MKKIMAFLKDEEGASLIEYVLLAALIGVVAVVAMTNVGTTASTVLTNADNAMQGS